MYVQTVPQIRNVAYFCVRIINIRCSSKEKKYFKNVSTQWTKQSFLLTYIQWVVVLAQQAIHTDIQVGHRGSAAYFDVSLLNFRAHGLEPPSTSVSPLTSRFTPIFRASIQSFCLGDLKVGHGILNENRSENRIEKFINIKQFVYRYTCFATIIQDVSY